MEHYYINNMHEFVDRVKAENILAQKTVDSINNVYREAIDVANAINDNTIIEDFNLIEFIHQLFQKIITKAENLTNDILFHSKSIDEIVNNIKTLKLTNEEIITDLEKSNCLVETLFSAIFNLVSVINKLASKSDILLADMYKCKMCGDKTSLDVNPCGKTSLDVNLCGKINTLLNYHSFKNAMCFSS